MLSLQHMHHIATCIYRIIIKMYSREYAITFLAYTICKERKSYIDQYLPINTTSFNTQHFISVHLIVM